MGASWWLCYNRRCQWFNAIAVGIVLRVLSYKVCTNIERAETLRISKIRTLRLLCCLAISCKFFIVIYFWIWYTVSLSRQFICCIIFFINPRTDTKIDQKKLCPLGTTVLVPHQLWNFSTKHRLKKSFDCKKWCISGWQTPQTLYFFLFVLSRPLHGWYSGVHLTKIRGLWRNLGYCVHHEVKLSP